MRSRMVLAVFLATALACRAAGVDRNGNGLSDVWEFIYNASTLTASGDADNDGFANAEEALAGTNPFEVSSFPHFQAAPIFPVGLQFTWDSFPGKTYTLLGRSNALDGLWQMEARSVATTASSTTNLNISSISRFFRMAINDTDTDGDGLTDYEELAIGFDPRTAHTERNDQLDGLRVTNGLSALSVVSISTLDGMMFERWPDPGLLAVRRTGGLLPLKVFLEFGGTAEFGVDYVTSATNFISFAAGAREAWIDLKPVPDAADAEPTETISVTVLPGDGYTLGTNTSATLVLTNETATSPPNPKSAARFLLQAAYGPDLAPANALPPNLQDVMGLGFDGWIEDQFTRPIGYLQPWVDWAEVNGSALQLYGNWKEFSWWSRAMGAPKLRPDSPLPQLPDPLRQRVAFALSEILVVSDRPEQLAVEQAGMANYYDLMVKHAFGNYRDLLREVALHPAMGIFLSHLGNQKAVPGSNVFPDENFAREIMQLFTIGLWELNPDGSRKQGTNGQPIATYSNRDITELARVLTGFAFGNNANFNLWPRDFKVPMKCWDEYHDCDAKTLLGGLQLPARTPSPGATGAAGLADLDAAVSNFFAHPNVGPFIGRQLIQRLVTSNPSGAYVGRVASAFADDGNGVRGDLKAVVKAILLDPEARDPVIMNQPTWGKLREPVLRIVNLARAFNAASSSGHYPLDQFTTDHQQDPMNAPSVFNFFLPGHSPPGPITQAGLVAPEFQVLNASTAITGPNYFWNAVQNDLHHYGNGTPGYAVRLNLTNELALVAPATQINADVPTGPAADPDPLLRRLDLGLTGGTLSPAQFQIIREAMLRIDISSWQWHRERLRLAIYLIVTSADFNVLR